MTIEALANAFGYVVTKAYTPVPMCAGINLYSLTFGFSFWGPSTFLALFGLYRSSQEQYSQKSQKSALSPRTLDG